MTDAPESSVGWAVEAIGGWALVEIDDVRLLLGNRA